MEFQKMTLALAESSDVDPPFRFDSRSLQRWPVGHR